MVRSVFFSAVATVSGIATMIATFPVAAVPLYVATPLGTLPGGQYSFGKAINATGQVTGYASTSNRAQHAFLYSAGVLRDLGTLDKSGAPEFGSSGESINASGQVTGTSATGLVDASHNSILHAFLYSDSGMVDLGTLAGLGSSSAAGINDAGQVIGLATTPQGQSVFLYANGVMTDFMLTHAPPPGAPAGINATGSVTATANSGDFRLHAPVVYGPAGTIDIGGLGFDSAVKAINNRGQVTGWSVNTSRKVRAFLYSPPPAGSTAATVGTIQDLGSLSGGYSEGLGLNTRGQVVGDSESLQGDLRAFLYSDGTMYDLNSLVISGLGSVPLLDATAINDRGQIVANACVEIFDTTYCNAYLLTPVPTPPAVVAVEYYYAAWDHYFVTAFPDEIAALDGGAFGGVWKRTGQTFPVWTEAGTSGSPTCRYFSTAFAPKSSHFYSPFASECSALAKNPSWQFEAVAFYLPLPDSNWACTRGTAPLYRLYNNGMGGAPNHRYTTSLTTLYQMVVAGWTFEGNGDAKVFACVPTN